MVLIHACEHGDLVLRVYTLTVAILIETSARPRHMHKGIQLKDFRFRVKCFRVKGLGLGLRLGSLISIRHGYRWQ